MSVEVVDGNGGGEEDFWWGVGDGGLGPDAVVGDSERRGALEYDILAEWASTAAVQVGEGVSEDEVRVLRSHAGAVDLRSRDPTDDLDGGADGGSAAADLDVRVEDVATEGDSIWVCD